MVFSSLTFLFYFLPGALLLYFLAPARWKNFTLFLSSLIFYGWGEPRSLWILLLSLFIGYQTGLLIDKNRGTKKSFYWLILSVTFSLGVLGLFKYADFILASLSNLTNLPIKPLNLKLPIGISFYTFQMMSYTIDVHRGSVKIQRSFVDLAAYITMFPQLIAGPIVRYADIEPQLKVRDHQLANISQGLRRFLLGLGKKVLLANTLGVLAQTARSSQDSSVLFLWLYAVSFSLQLYFDFSGYSDMAIGLGGILGFQFMENFNYPFIAKSITDFWRRWHISLGSWFRDYVYIPLGGSRTTSILWILNLLIVWGLTGLWHGAAWTFVLWGLYFALLLLIEKIWLKNWLELSKALRHIYVLFLVMISFILFDSADLSLALIRIGGLFGANGLPLVSVTALYQLKSNALLLLIAAIGATPWPKQCYQRLANSRFQKVLSLSETPILFGLALSVTAFLVDGSFNPFLYFRF
ncbi:MAG: MBOAT family protein [Clostridium sp.]|nr:MBOAT family protein [Clostridium sp.]